MEPDFFALAHMLREISEEEDAAGRGHVLGHRRAQSRRHAAGSGILSTGEETGAGYFGQNDLLGEESAACMNIGAILGRRSVEHRRETGGDGIALTATCRRAALTPSVSPEPAAERLWLKRGCHHRLVAGIFTSRFPAS